MQVFTKESIYLQYLHISPDCISETHLQEGEICVDI